MDSPIPVALLAGSLRSASPVLFSVSGLSALGPVVQVCLRAARVSAWWTVPFLLALSGAPGFQSFFSFSSAQISLSLSRPFLLQPLAPGVLLVGACVCLGYFHGLDCPSPSHGGLPIGIPAFLSGSLPVALSNLPGEVRLFCFAGRPSSPFFWFIRGVRCSSWLSPLHSARFWFIVFSVPYGWVGALLPSLRPAPGLSLFGLLAVPPFLLSRFLAVCFTGLWASLFPGSFLVLGSSFPVHVFYSFLLRGTRGGVWILPSAPLGCFILLSRLVSYFCFLRRLFRLFRWFQGFLSYFSDLVFCSSQSCLGLQWFWSSCPFHCWGSQLPLPIAVFRISSRGLVPFCSRIL